MNLIFSFLPCLLLLKSIGFCGTDNFWYDPSRLYVGHTEGNWLDNSDGYTSLNLFSTLPIFETSPFMTFVDVRGHFFNDGRKSANVGLGLRYQLQNSSHIFGVNTFYDYREASWDHNFHQIGIGFEYLGPRFDMRLNGYVPIGNSVANSKTSVYHYKGGYVATTKAERVSYGGADFEIGTWLKRNNSSSQFDLYGAIGAYYYAARTHQLNDYGSLARLEAQFLEYFAFEIQGGFDAINNGAAQGTLSVAIPLDLLFNNPTYNNPYLDRNIYQSVNRQEIIALSKKQCCWTWNWDSPQIPCSN